MFKLVQVFRAEFKTAYGSSSTLIAVENLDDVKDAINEYEVMIDGTFIGIEEQCVMTPFMYVKK